MVTATDESALIAALRAGDPNAFAALVDQHTPAMLRVAAGHVPSHAIAVEVVQETWIALDKLSERQRAVVTLRDMLGFDSTEVCELLDITAASQRVLLHRGRAAIRQVLEEYVRGGSPT
jgi:RNA polymerase sigma-70 factor, ECF subfamily